jgi:hypothetical protein
MLERVRKRLRKQKETLGANAVSKTPPKLKSMEERRQEALKYLVEKHFEWKRREEEYRRKLESYGKVGGWVYKRIMGLKYSVMIFSEIIVKPFIMTVLICSSIFSLLLGMTVGLQFSEFTRHLVMSPFNDVLNVLVLFPLGFSPSILSIILTYYVEKRKVKRLLEDYGVSAQFP